MEKFGHPSGKTIKCFWCPKVMRTRWEVDRYPICGHDGGRYTRDNIVPACPRCNKNRCTVAKKCRVGQGHRGLSR